MQDFKKSYFNWKKEQIKRLIEWCEKQKHILQQKEFAELSSIQTQKMELIREIEKRERELNFSLKGDEQEVLKDLLERLLACERELMEMAEATYLNVKRKLLAISKGLNTLDHYRLKLPKRTKFINQKT